MKCQKAKIDSIAVLLIATTLTACPMGRYDWNAPEVISAKAGISRMWEEQIRGKYDRAISEAEEALRSANKVHNPNRHLVSEMIDLNVALACLKNSERSYEEAAPHLDNIALLADMLTTELPPNRDEVLARLDYTRAYIDMTSNRYGPAIDYFRKIVPKQKDIKKEPGIRKNRLWNEAAWLSWLYYKSRDCTTARFYSKKVISGAGDEVYSPPLPERALSRAVMGLCDIRSKNSQSAESSLRQALLEAEKFESPNDAEVILGRALEEASKAEGVAPDLRYRLRLAGREHLSTRVNNRVPCPNGHE